MRQNQVMATPSTPGAATPRASTPRARARAQTEAEILRIGREHLATTGPAGLSLRAIARELGVVSSAVYRYVASRDELLTRLVIDAYQDLGDAVDAALESVDVTDFAARLRTLAHAVRDWARSEPATYALLFGTPVPGYEAPGDRTTEPGTRVIRALVDIVEAAWQARAVAELPASTVPASVSTDADQVRAAFGVTVPDDLVVRTTVVWAGVFGLVNFEIFGQYGEAFTDVAALFDLQVTVLVESLGLTKTS